MKNKNTTRTRVIKNNNQKANDPTAEPESGNKKTTTNNTANKNMKNTGKQGKKGSCSADK